MTSVRAAVLRAHGAPPELEHRPAPQAEAGQLLVEVHAVPLTPLDLLCAGGTSYFGPPALPYVPGVQGVGVVRAASTLPAGTPVWFATSAGMAPGDGSLAPLVTVGPADVVPLEHGVPAPVVAALGLSAVAACCALLDTGRLSAGEQVVVLGAGGVVGQVAVQLARLHGARRVIAAVRSDAAAARATSVGADAVVRLDDGDVDGLAERLTAACDGPADLVLDPLWGAPAAAALRTLGPHGRLVNLGGSAGAEASLDSATLRSRSLQVLGYTNTALTAEQRRDALAAVVGHAARGELAVEHERVPLDDVAEAWQRVADGRAPVRVVIDLTAPPTAEERARDVPAAVPEHARRQLPAAGAAHRPGSPRRSLPAPRARPRAVAAGAGAPRRGAGRRHPAGGPCVGAGRPRRRHRRRDPPRELLQPLRHRARGRRRRRTGRSPRPQWPPEPRAAGRRADLAPGAGAVRDVQFLRAATDRTIKVTVPGPFTMSQQAQDEHYGSGEALALAYAEVVRAEVLDLFAAGADVVQVDEPYMQARPDAAREYGVAALTRALDGVEGTTAVHICFGYAAIIHERPSGYSFLPELADVPCDQVSIETAQSNLDTSVLAALADKTVLLGVLDLSDPEVEPAQTVVDRVRRALPHVDAERVVLAPDCGMKYLPRASADGKMRAMAEAAAVLRRGRAPRSSPDAPQPLPVGRGGAAVEE